MHNGDYLVGLVRKLFSELVKNKQIPSLRNELWYHKEIINMFGDLLKDISPQDIERFIVPRMLAKMQEFAHKVMPAGRQLSKGQLQNLLKEDCPCLPERNQEHIQFLRETITQLKTNGDVVALPPPIRHYKNSSQRQRRMDSLARVLAPEKMLTACVATAVVKDEFVIASNSTHEEKKKEAAMATIAKRLSEKLVIIQEFLRDMAQGVTPNPGVEDIKFSLKANLLVHRAVVALMEKGCADILPISKEEKGRRHSSILAHYKNALFKLAKSYLLSIYSEGKLGFAVVEREALMAKPRILFPQTAAGGDFHAEQVIAAFVKAQHQCYVEVDPTAADPALLATHEPSPATAQAGESSASAASFFVSAAAAEGTPEDTHCHLENRQVIGISKLCCQACVTYFEKHPEFSYRGGHGVGFYGVMDIDTLAVSPFIPTLKHDSAASAATGSSREAFVSGMCPSDSDSDCEFDHDPTQYLDEALDIPGMETLLDSAPQGSSSKTDAVVLVSENRALFFTTVCGRQSRASTSTSTCTVGSTPRLVPLGAAE